MIRYMLDTNIVIYTLNNRPTKVRERFKTHHGEMCISAVTLMELYYGAENSSSRDVAITEIDIFAERLVVLDYDSDAAAHTGEIRGVLRRSGSPVGPYDAMIAGHARANGLIVVTNNLKEFKRVPGIRVENWAR
jgi:tRNA(fMet)-specific endonuclease VapC